MKAVLRAARGVLIAILLASTSLGASSCATQGIYGEDGGLKRAVSAAQREAERAATATVVTAKRAYVEVISAAAKANEAGTLSTDDYARVLEAGWQVYPALLAADEALKAYFRLATSERDPAALVAILVDLQMAYNKFREAAKAEGVN